MSRRITGSRALMSYAFPLIVLTIGMGAAQAQTSVLISSVFGVSATLNPAGWSYTNSQGTATDPYSAFAGPSTGSSNWLPTVSLLSTSYQVAPWEGTWDGSNNSSVPAGWGVSDASSTLPLGTTGGKSYDIEAMYVGNNAQNIYVSIVTSIPPPPGQYNNPWNSLMYTGDIGIDVTQPNSGNTGRTYNGSGFSYDYGINLTNDTYDPSTGNAVVLSSASSGVTVPVNQPSGTAQTTTTVDGSSSIGNGLYQTLAGSWYVANGPSDPNPVYTNFDPSYNSGSGSTSVFVANLPTVTYTQLMYTPSGGTAQPVLDNGVPMYVINATVPLSDFSNLTSGDQIGFSYAPGCRNDYMQVFDTIQLGSYDTVASTPELPTPALLVLSMAPMGLAWAKRRRKRS